MPVAHVPIEIPRVAVYVRRHKNCMPPDWLPIPQLPAFYRLFYMWCTRLNRDPLSCIRDLALSIEFFYARDLMYGKYFGEYRGMHYIRLSRIALYDPPIFNRMLIHELRHVFHNLVAETHVVVNGFRRHQPHRITCPAAIRYYSAEQLEEIEEEDCAHAEREFFPWIQLMEFPPFGSSRFRYKEAGGSCNADKNAAIRREPCF